MGIKGEGGCGLWAAKREEALQSCHRKQELSTGLLSPGPRAALPLCTEHGFTATVERDTWGVFL